MRRNEERMDADHIKKLPADIGKALLAGLIAAAAAAILFFVIGLIAGGWALSAGLESAKNGLLLIASLLLFLLAGMLLMKGKKPEQKPKKNGWRDHFKVIGYKTAIALIAVAFLALASVADYILLRG